MAGCSLLEYRVYPSTLIVCRDSQEKSAVSLTGVPLKVMCSFSCAQFRFGDKLDYYASWWRSFVVCLLGCLCFLYLDIPFSPHSWSLLLFHWTGILLFLCLLEILGQAMLCPLIVCLWSQILFFLVSLLFLKYFWRFV